MHTVIVEIWYLKFINTCIQSYCTGIGTIMYDCSRADRGPFHLHGLTHWGRVTHICVSKLTIIGSDNGLSPGRRQAIIYTNAGILLIRTSGTNFGEILSEIHTFSFKKIHLQMSSAKWRPFCLGLNELTVTPWISNHMPRKVWDEIIYPFPNFNGCTVEVCEWICNFIPHFII